MTKAETILWTQLKGRKLLGQKFRRQHSINNYVVDFFCSSLKLAIEIDGLTHLSKEEIEKDFERQSEIEKFGVEFLRFDNDRIYNDLANVIDEIINKIKVVAGTK